MLATIDQDGYLAATQRCALLDRSERGKLALAGGEAKTFLTGQVTNDVESLTPGIGQYATFLTPKGKMLGDLRILDLGEELWLDTERITLQPLFDLIHRANIGFDAQLHKQTLERGLLSAIGPRADSIVGIDLALEEHANASSEIDGVAITAVRTYLGVDLICAAERTTQLIEALRKRGAEPISEAVYECLRIERGRPRYGYELDETTIPQEAGLNDRAVSFTKGCYVGQETVARLFYKGRPNRHLLGLFLSEPVEPGVELKTGERVVGTLGSTAISPNFGPIGLALLRREVEPDDSLTTEEGVTARITELPFGHGSIGDAA